MAMSVTALVTGASRGIGRAIACRLSRDGFGVAISDLPSQKSQLEEVQAYITQQGGKAVTTIANVSVESEVKQMVESVVEQMGGLDVMVANAGIVVRPSIFIDTTVEDFQRIFNVNTLGTFLCYKYAAQQMVKQGRGGRIIGASSLAGKTAFPLSAAYGTSKFAVRGLTQNAALDLAKNGITVNAYAPGPIDTPMLQAFGELSVHLPAADLAAMKVMERLTTPVGFNGTPEDIAGLVSYLASKESRFVTGQTISINGGLFFD
ncbi:NAD(P)-binding protein [Phlegmacium glaucopus]|nr:NAD(P)-binding protein [Phlegmacium glaucopus]